MKNKKPFVFGETKGLDKSFEHGYFKPYQFTNQAVCSFCADVLTDGAVRFKGIAACADCLKLWKVFDENLRSYLAERKVNYVAF